MHLVWFNKAWFTEMNFLVIIIIFNIFLLVVNFYYFAEQT